MNDYKIYILSAGYNKGNYSEIIGGDNKTGSNKIILPNYRSRRGMNIATLSFDKQNQQTDIQTNIFTFDFYPVETSNLINNNFINLLHYIPNNTYILFSVKDDSFTNMFGYTKQYLNDVIGLKNIYNLKYRDSYCAIVYKHNQADYSLIDEKLDSRQKCYIYTDISKYNNDSYIQHENDTLNSSDNTCNYSNTYLDNYTHTSTNQDLSDYSESDNSECSDFSIMTSNTKISLNDKKIKKKSSNKISTNKISTNKSSTNKSSEKITLELLNSKVIKLTKTVDELKNKVANIYSSYGYK